MVNGSTCQVCHCRYDVSDSGNAEKQVDVRYCVPYMEDGTCDLYLKIGVEMVVVDRVDARAAAETDPQASDHKMMEATWQCANSLTPLFPDSAPLHVECQRDILQWREEARERHVQR
ncbi:uncharacterized protein SETTUDRAFT_161126 [Exserohilum turcica Et28A]|uniref:Uncharacterized protein n=1 Tax=Exserohilum turcicum (strain 28A) TaxID=671987 RepID=R0K3E2_EXST2|nr:uncharacterized protein SETTUDRAFT_161126 [Exserohilum turcica Et28A]EOA87593.1 hypothetical protein SETTUDRAFT_161126 [Exserohilum turcica Et28A]